MAANSKIYLKGGAKAPECRHNAYNGSQNIFILTEIRFNNVLLELNALLTYLLDDFICVNRPLYEDLSSALFGLHSLAAEV